MINRNDLRIFNVGISSPLFRIIFAMRTGLCHFSNNNALSSSALALEQQLMNANDRTTIDSCVRCLVTICIRFDFSRLHCSFKVSAKLAMHVAIETSMDTNNSDLILALNIGFIKRNNILCMCALFKYWM